MAELSEKEVEEVSTLLHRRVVQPGPKRLLPDTYVTQMFLGGAVKCIIPLTTFTFCTDFPLRHLRVAESYRGRGTREGVRRGTMKGEYLSGTPYPLAPVIPSSRYKDETRRSGTPRGRRELGEYVCTGYGVGNREALSDKT